MMGMDELVKLQLDNNIITKIQGLESLTKLRWLDLSFNMIEKIEGLDNLRLLEDLSLFSNRITKIEGLNNLEKLNVLSVGSNNIESLEDAVKYLHGLRNNLEVLKIIKNGFKEVGEKEYKGRIIAYLPQLKYLDYELIEAKEREKAETDYKTELEGTNLETEDTKDNSEQKEALKALEEAHIHFTQNMFDSCCKAFEEYDKIAGFQKFQEVWAYSDANIDESISNFQNLIKSKHREKKKIIAFCLEKMRKAERNAEVESISKIEEYKKKEKHIFRRIKAERDVDSGRPVNYNNYENELIQLIEILKGDLMDIEVAL